MGPNAHNHVSNVVFPGGDVGDGPVAVSDRILRRLLDLVEPLKTRNVTLVNILDIFTVDETFLALERLLFARVEVEAAAVDWAPLAQLGRRARTFRLHH